MTDPTETTPEATDAMIDTKADESGLPTFDEMLTAVSAFYRKSSKP